MSVYINRVYTKSGDRGTTRLAGGQERAKDDPRLEAYGTVDELNAVLGLLADLIHQEWRKYGRQGWAEIPTVRRIQNELFDLGGELATLAEDRHPKQALITEADVTRLETEIDEANAPLPALRSFILPGGGVVSAQYHVARTVCRRAERRLISLHAVEPQRELTIQYLNRLSDWLFVMGRSAAVANAEGESLWKPGDRT